MPPTIKGIFVMSHVRALRALRGASGVAELERRFGRPLDFPYLANVPVSDEVRLLECAAQILADDRIPPAMLASEAGRLHFQNFATTPFGRLLLRHVQNPKPVFLNAHRVAEHVFRGISFSADDLGTSRMKIAMEGGCYPLAHFQGFFLEWLEALGYRTAAEARAPSPERYEYLITWEPNTHAEASPLNGNQKHYQTA